VYRSVYKVFIPLHYQNNDNSNSDSKHSERTVENVENITNQNQHDDASDAATILPSSPNPDRKQGRFSIVKLLSGPPRSREVDRITQKSLAIRDLKRDADGHFGMKLCFVGEGCAGKTYTIVCNHLSLPS
jgi:hypothetical protein